jgi:type I restriction enzyme, S subunit
VKGSLVVTSYSKTSRRSAHELPRTVRVREVAESIQYGHTASAISREEGPRFLRITDIQDGAVDWDSVPSCNIVAEDVPRYRLSTGDLVFARTGATTGKSFLIRDCPDAVFASYLIRVRASKDVDPRYLALFFQSPDYWQQIERGKRGIGQPNVNGKTLGEIELPLRPLDEQRPDCRGD